MTNNPRDNSALSRLIKISQYIISDPGLVEEMIEEVKSGATGPLCSMYKNLFKNNLLTVLSPIPELSEYFFSLGSINELPIFSSSQLGITCFFMPKDTMFPLHDHKNKIVCTGVLYGKIRYMALNKTGKNPYCLSSKGIALSRRAMFATEEFGNIHSLLGVEDSIILDIFLPNSDQGDDATLFSVVKKRKREFFLDERRVCGHKRISQ